MAETRRLWLPALAGGLLFLMVWLNVQATLLGYKAGQAREAVEKLKAHNAYLRLELDQAQSPASLEKEAARRLNMSRPDPEQMVVLGAAPESSAEPAPRSKPLRLALSLGHRIRRAI